MFDFDNLVSNVLLEQPVPNQTGGNDSQNVMKLEGFEELINAYTTQYGKTPDVNEILKAVNIITGGKYIAAKYTNIGYIPFIDAFAQSYNLINDKNKSNFTQTDIINFLVQNSETFNPVFSKVAANLKNTTNVQDYEPANPDVNRAWRSLMAETNKLSQVAVQSLGSDTVHTAVTKIIAKRIPILDRVMGLKGLVKPFNQSVITPILHQFKKYTGYKQGDVKKNPTGWLKDRLWPKKVPGDFSKMVEDISANNLLNIAVLAYEYYIYLLSTQGKPLNATSEQPAQQTPETQMKLPGFENASLNLFDKFINNVLIENKIQEDVSASSWKPSAQQPQQQQPQQQPQQPQQQPQTQQQQKPQQQKPQQQKTQQPTGGLPSEQIEKITNQVGNAVDPDYQSFIDEGQSRYLPKVKYDLNTISKDPSSEAKALYKALTDMAYFIRPRLSAAQRIGAAAGALGALRVGMGPVN